MCTALPYFSKFLDPDHRRDDMINLYYTGYMWHAKHIFNSRAERQIALARFVNFYNTAKPHAGINNMTPYELLTEYFKDVNNGTKYHT